VFWKGKLGLKAVRFTPTALLDAPGRQNITKANYLKALPLNAMLRKNEEWQESYHHVTPLF
ncbi:hypothetical protein CE195_10840, partial [Sodalis-like symbiont of Philaenus spumarius]